MGAPNWKLFTFLAKTFDIKTFVETGSGHGCTALEAVKLFPSVYTIELSDSLYQETEKKLGYLAHCYHGKSVDALKEILYTFGSQSIIYWLDAHWSGGPTAGESEQCPLLDELDVINNRGWNNDFIFIDDAHTFFSPAVLKPPYDPRQFPSLMQIFAKLNKKNRYTVILTSMHYVRENDGIVMPEDVIVSVPDYAMDQLYSWLLTLKLEGPK